MPRALVLDDVAENRDLLCKMLSELGCNAVAVGDTDDAFHHAKLQRPDIFFTDILMPGVDTISFVQNMRSLHDGLPVVAVTALIGTDTRVRHAIWNAVLTKPVRLEQLQHCIGEVLGIQGFQSAQQPLEFNMTETFCTPDVVQEIPAQMRTRLLSSAEMGSITDIKTCLVEMAVHSDVAARFAERVREKLRRFDMEGIVRLVAVNDSVGEQIDARVAP